MNVRQPSSPPDIPGLRYVRLLGMGGFADVFLYEELALGRRSVGVKVLLTEIRRDLHEAFESEASIMARLSTHPSIVTIHRVGIAQDGRPYLVMEYCPPPHLANKIKQNPLSVPTALEIGIEIAGAVETAHQANVLHRDIKPANILFTEFDDPALTDFGIASSTSTGRSGGALGASIPWASPEQLTRDQPMGETGDVWSLAATVYAMLAGRSPFWSRTEANSDDAVAHRVLHRDIEPIQREDVPRSLVRVLQLAMNKNANARYPSALEFAKALQTVQNELHLPITQAAVKRELAVVDPDDEDRGGTRVATYESIDPEGPSSFTSSRGDGLFLTGRTAGAPVGRQGPPVVVPPAPVDMRPLQVAREFTAPSLPGLVESPTYVPADPLQPGPGWASPGSATDAQTDAGQAARKAPVRALVLLGVVVLVAGVGGLVAVLRPDGHGTTPRASATSVAPKDPIGQDVPQVTGLKVTLSGGKVSATWANPEPLSGDSFLYRVIDPVSPRDYVQVAASSVTVPAERGRTCLEVLLRRSNGRASDPTAGCVDTP